MEWGWGALLATGTLIAASAAWLVWRRSSGRESLPGRKLSFVSRAIFENTFPDEVDVMSVINGVLQLEGPVSAAEIVDLLDNVAEKQPETHRLWSTVQPVAGGDLEFVQVEDRRAAITRRVSDVVVNGDAELVSYVQSVIDEKLPLDEPLFAILCVRNEGGSSSALIVRVHHAVSDGYGLIDLFDKLLTSAEGGPMVPGKGAAKRRPIKFSVPAFLKTLVKLATLPMVHDSETPLRTPRGENGIPLCKAQRRQCAVSKPLSLDFVKAATRAFTDDHFSVNDVLTGVLGGALRRYVEAHDPSCGAGDSIRLRAMVPISLPRKGEKMRNRWCFVSCSLHAELPTTGRIERVRRVHNSMEEIKSSGEAAIQLLAQTAAVPVTNLAIRRKVVSEQFQSHTVVFSNVPGPAQPARICGKLITGCYCPLSNVITQFIVFSYNGAITVSVVADVGVVPRPDDLIDLFVEELEALGREARLDAKEYPVYAANH